MTIPPASLWLGRSTDASQWAVRISTIFIGGSRLLSESSYNLNGGNGGIVTIAVTHDDGRLPSALWDGRRGGGGGQTQPIGVRAYCFANSVKFEGMGLSPWKDLSESLQYCRYRSCDSSVAIPDCLLSKSRRHFVNPNKRTITAADVCRNLDPRSVKPECA